MSQSPWCWKVTVDPELGQDLSGNPVAKAAPPSHEALSVTEALPATDSSSASKQRDSNGTEDDGAVNAEEDGDEGGVWAWLAILGSFLVYFASFGVANSFGYFQTFYQLEYLPDSSPSVISFIGTIQITLLYLTGSVAGALFDAYGFKVCTLPSPCISLVPGCQLTTTSSMQYLYPVAALGGAGSLLATSFAQPRAIWQLFLAQGLLLGLTISAGVQPALAVAGQYFRERRALAMGIVASGSSAGGVCLPIMFQRLVPLIGFRWAMRVGALIVSVCYIIAICVSRARFPPEAAEICP
jgi:MFS family permease